MTDNKVDTEFAALMQESIELIHEVESYLHDNGVTYNLAEWITMKEYAKRHNLESTNVVSNWLLRGKIPAEDVRSFPYLNDLRLIRDKLYK